MHTTQMVRGSETNRQVQTLTSQHVKQEVFMPA
jgi:hypothetical protein